MMTLHVYIENNNKKILVSSLDFASLEILQPIFKQFQIKTSVLLSEYDNAVFPSNYSYLLTQLIDEFFKNKITSGEISKLRNALKLANNDGLYIYFLGE